MSDTITITGNVATIPEHKRTANGVAITTFRVASAQRRYDRSSGTWTDAGTNWYTVSAFRGLADHAYSSLRKGDRVVLTGRLRLREWDNGTKRGIAVEIDAEAIGHDLLWGTSSFVKSSQASAPDRDAGWSEPRESDAWAAPGIGHDGAQDGGPTTVAALEGAAPVDSNADRDMDGDAAMPPSSPDARDRVDAEVPF
jgi:single-strand DNA-binding protein